jgi:hypothetical protein
MTESHCPAAMDVSNTPSGRRPNRPPTPAHLLPYRVGADVELYHLQHQQLARCFMPHLHGKNSI